MRDQRFRETFLGSKIPATFAAVALLMAGIILPPADAASRQWSTSGAGKNVATADCNNCDEDIGILITCTETGEGADALVYWLANDQGQENEVSSLSISIDGNVFDRQARVQYDALVGYAPQFKLPYADPVFEALQAGAIAEFSFGGESVSIPLIGSRKALGKFKVECASVD